MTSRSKATPFARPRRNNVATATAIAAALVWCGCSARSETSNGAFNGAWNIISADATRIAWLKIQGAETGRPAARFVMGTAGGGGGSYRDIGISISRGELRFHVRRNQESTPGLTNFTQRGW